MKVRDATQTAKEKAIFDVFLRVCPGFASAVVDHFAPEEDRFPDRIVDLKNGTRLAFELTQWLHTEQTAKSKELQRLTEVIEEAIGAQSIYSPQHIRFVMLGPKIDFPRMKNTEMDSFRDDVWTLIKKVDQRWPAERFWVRGHGISDLRAYPTLNRYIARVYFEPLTVPDRLDAMFPTGQSWIFMEAPGGPYSPDTALSSLWRVLEQKIERKYGGPLGPIRLLVYYNEAIMHNTYWHGIKFRNFSDVAREAAQRVAKQTRYENIYLLKALEPTLEAYEIFPALAKC